MLFKKILILAVLLVIASFVSASGATFYAGNAVYSFATNKDVYNPGETVFVNGYGSGGVCANGGTNSLNLWIRQAEYGLADGCFLFSGALVQPGNTGAVGCKTLLNCCVLRSTNCATSGAGSFLASMSPGWKTVSGFGVSFTSSGGNYEDCSGGRNYGSINYLINRPPVISKIEIKNASLPARIGVSFVDYMLNYNAAQDRIFCKVDVSDADGDTVGSKISLWVINRDGSTSKLLESPQYVGTTAGYTFDVPKAKVGGKLYCVANSTDGYITVSASSQDTSQIPNYAVRSFEQSQ